MADIVIDAWVWQLETQHDEVLKLGHWLSRDERDRALRFLSAAHGESFIAGRGALREALALYMGLPPDMLQFAYGAAGKPALLGTDAPQFNLSHSHGWAALAVTSRYPVGIDIEAVRPIRENLAERFFSPAETEAIAALDASEQLAAFYRCWTRKEAFLKAAGDGLNTPLSSFQVSVASDMPPEVLHIDGATMDDIKRWRLFNLDVGPGIAGAVALKTDGATDNVSLRYCV